MFSLKKAEEIQRHLAKKLILRWDSKPVSLIAGGDCSYDRHSHQIGAAIIVQKIPEFEIVEISHITRPVSIPYIPGFLNFREGPVFAQAFRLLKTKPDITLVDGNGIAHPRRMGLASYVGVILDICTVGCAKKPFFPYESPGTQRGESSPFLNKEKKQVGICLRTRSGIKPIFVSPGHKIDIQASRHFVLLSSRFKIPEPLRLAHQCASQLFKA